MTMIDGSGMFFTVIFLSSILMTSESFVLNNVTDRCLPGSVACRCIPSTWYIDDNNFPAIDIDCGVSNTGVLPDFHVISLMNIYHFYVNVTKNNIAFLPGGSFTGFSPINVNTTSVTIDLKDNRISKIENNAFIGLENIDFEINLSGNNLTYLPFAFLILNQLHGLYIEYNPIKTLDTNILQHIAPMMIYMELGIDNLQTWPAELSTFSKLRMIWLYGILQYQLPRRPFNGSENKIRDLGIFGSDLKMLPCALTNLTMLEFLTIRHSPNLSATNLIETCRPNYTMSSTVHEIHLVEGALTEFPNILKYTPMLTTLNLYRNQIQHVNEDFIPMNNVLTDLMLSYNHLKNIPSSFLRFKHLKILILDNNNIATVAPALENFLVHQRLSSLCLRDNPVNTTALAIKCSASRDSWAH